MHICVTGWSRVNSCNPKLRVPPYTIGPVGVHYKEVFLHIHCSHILVHQ